MGGDYSVRVEREAMTVFLSLLSLTWKMPTAMKQITKVERRKTSSASTVRFFINLSLIKYYQDAGYYQLYYQIQRLFHWKGMYQLAQDDNSNISLQFGYSPFKEQDTPQDNQSCHESLEYLSEVFQQHQEDDFGIQLQQKFGISNEQSRFEDNKYQNNFDASSNQHIQLSVSITPHKENVQPLQKNHKEWELVSFSDVVSPQSQLNMLSNLTTPKTYLLGTVLQSQQDQQVILEVSNDQTILDQSLTLSKFQRNIDDDHKLLRARKLEQLQQALKSQKIKKNKENDHSDKPSKSQLKSKTQLTESKQMLKAASSKIDNYLLQNFRKITQPSVGVIEIMNSLLQLLNGLCLQVTKFKIIGEIKNWKRLCAILGQSQAILSAINKMDIVIEQNLLPESNVRNAIKYYEESMEYGDQTYRGQEESKIVLIKQFILKGIEYYYVNLRVKDKEIKKEKKHNLQIQIDDNNFYSHQIDNDNNTVPFNQIKAQNSEKNADSTMKKYQSCQTFKQEQEFKQIQNQLKKVKNQRNYLQQQIT